MQELVLWVALMGAVLGKSSVDPRRGGAWGPRQSASLAAGACLLAGGVASAAAWAVYSAGSRGRASVAGFGEAEYAPTTNLHSQHLP